MKVFNDAANLRGKKWRLIYIHGDNDAVSPQVCFIYTLLLLSHILVKVWAARLQFTVSLKYPGCHQVFQITCCCSESRGPTSPWKHQSRPTACRHLQTLGTKWNETEWNTRAGPLSFYHRCMAQTPALHSILKLLLLSVLFGTTLTEGDEGILHDSLLLLKIGEEKKTHTNNSPPKKQL